MKKSNIILSVFASALISASAIAGSGEYNLGSSEFKAPNLQPSKSIQAIQATAGNKGITESGFFFHYTPFLPTKKYFWPKSAVIDGRSATKDTLALFQSVGKWGFGHGLELGNMFRLTDFAPMAIGIKATWFGFGVTSFKPTNTAIDSSNNIKGIATQVQLLKIGPYFSYALTDQMALDAYYQVSPTGAFGAITGTYQNQSYLYPILAFGLTHEMGITYRFDMLSVGVAYNTGTVNLTGSVNNVPFEFKSYTNNFKFMIGIKI